MIIAPVLEGDLTALAELYQDLTGKETNLEKLTRTFASVKDNPDYVILGAKTEAGELVGSLMGVVCHDIVEDCRPFMLIENVIVKGGYRGRGIGKMLMNQIEQIATNLDCSHVKFVSAAERTGAHAFYEAVGYRGDVVKGFKKRLFH